MKCLKFTFLFLLCLSVFLIKDFRQTNYVNLQLFEKERTENLTVDNEIDFSDVSIRPIQQFKKQKRNRIFSPLSYFENELTLKVRINITALILELTDLDPIRLNIRILYCIYRL